MRKISNALSKNRLESIRGEDKETLVMTISAQPQRPMRRRDRELPREEALRAARAAGHAVLSFIHPDTGKVMDFRLPVPGTWPAWGIRQENDNGTTV